MTIPATPLDSAACIEALCADPRPAELLGLRGSAGAYLLAHWQAQARRPLVVLTADGAAAARWADDLAFYCATGEGVRLLPGWDIAPYEPLAPPLEVEAQRMATLDALAQGRAPVLVLPVTALLQRVPPAATLQTLPLTLRVGDDIDRDRLLRQLTDLGYQSLPLVEDRGQLSVRGDLVDLYPPTAEAPVRLEFFGDTLERMRPFDPASQRSLDSELVELRLVPARELILHGRLLQTFADGVRDLCDALEKPRTVREAVLEELREGVLTPGRHALLPLNYGGLDSLLQLCAQATWAVVDPPAVEQALDQLAAEVQDGYRRQRDKGELVVPPEQLYLEAEEVNGFLRSCRRIDLSALELLGLGDERPRYRFHCLGNADLRLDRHDGDGLAALAQQLGDWQRQRWSLLLVCHQDGQARRLCDLLAPHGIVPERVATGEPLLVEGRLRLALGELTGGFRLPEEGVAVISEEEIFGPRRRQGRGRRKLEAFLSSLAELKEGDFIVHSDHGIGRYRGLLHLQLRGVEGDFLHLEYADGDKLYLPVERIEKVAKYQGADGSAPRLDKMGGQGWEKAKVRARAAVEELARELLQLYAKREMRRGHAFAPPERMYREFEAAFPFEETPDQLTAIDEVLADMQSERPMDRLVCGDVGYGKTEVAIRAAMEAVLDGKQVAVLVPTTILAEQHYETFRRRMQGFPVIVEMVSRFRTAAEIRDILERAAAGKIDILVGTHRLLQRDVRIKDLGLIIIDEEQRFGVAHKERLKRFRAEVDVLTLTATPIPRTLHMSMAGLRDLSVIDTPPVDRLAIRTYVTKFDEDLIRQAIRRELARGGQVFFVHNRVQTIDAIAEQLRALVPEASFAVGHGQMPEKALEQVMLDFIDGRTQVLVASAIIENGLDIPRANTILINRADCFGLSQLYQLRGRVGRSNVRAYAYLLIPGEGALTGEARERLRVLQELTELGAGFRVASHDLELRGAGDLLGARQSGQIAAVGFDMYTELLEETIAELQGREREGRIDPELRLGLSAFLPEAYLPDPGQRLAFYQKLAAAEDEEAVYATVDELADRFGEPPPPAQTLVDTMLIRVQLKKLRVELAEYDGRDLILGFHATTTVDPAIITSLLAQPDQRCRFTPDYRLLIRLGRLAPEALPEAVKKELRPLFGLC